MHRLAASLAAVVLAGGSLWLATPVTAVTCTYTFPPEGGSLGFDVEGSYGSWSNPVGDGDVICGGRGNDRIKMIWGGTFYGGPGDDFVDQQVGLFYGGPGDDGADMVAGSGLGYFFDGGPGDDTVNINQGTFYGGPGDDAVSVNAQFFYGGPGDDSVLYANYRNFYAGPGKDTVINNGIHTSRPDLAVFDGGPGKDTVINNGGTLISVP